MSSCRELNCRCYCCDCGCCGGSGLAEALVDSSLWLSFYLILVEKIIALFKIMLPIDDDKEEDGSGSDWKSLDCGAINSTGSIDVPFLNS